MLYAIASLFSFVNVTYTVYTVYYCCCPLFLLIDNSMLVL